MNAVHRITRIYYVNSRGYSDESWDVPLFNEIDSDRILSISIETALIIKER